MDYFGFQDKTAVVTGAASGMGEAAAQMLVDLGAHVHAVGRNKPILTPVEKTYKADLGDKADIERLLTELPEKIDAVFLCQGMAQTKDNHLRLMLVNYLGVRTLAEALAPRVADGGSITLISSNGGFGWERDFAACKEVLDLAAWDDAVAWFEAHDEKLMDAYRFSKRLLNTYVQYKVHDPLYIARKLRLNAICPGNTITALTDEFNRNTSPNGDPEEGRKIIESLFQKSWDGRWATAEEMGWPMVAIGSRLFSYMSGQVIMFDYGLTSVWNIEELQGITDHFHR
ncbi:MAG: SDR family oxidoreductase [Clostridiales Family XIII bacterium]|jgi:NAD(P)-dependent dehydrogenase (short-subunit alcohol dehydrogenase family)|nr:SDR family oxidoreductase [Clostridiales Family XIII bacterium]